VAKTYSDHHSTHRDVSDSEKRAAVSISATGRLRSSSRMALTPEPKNQKAWTECSIRRTSRYQSVGLRDPFSRSEIGSFPIVAMTGTRSMNLRCSANKTSARRPDAADNSWRLVEEAYRLDAEGQGSRVHQQIGVHPERANAFLPCHGRHGWDGECCARDEMGLLFSGNFDRGLPVRRAISSLTIRTTACRAAYGGMYVTFLRTAGCATVAAKYIAPGRRKRLGLIGGGWPRALVA